MTRHTFALLALFVTAPVFAQTPAPAAPAQNQNTAQLRLVVIDQTDAGIPTASVTLTPPVGDPIVVMTDDRGVVTIPSVMIGTIRVHVEFSGFEPYEGTVTVRRGTNNATITMALAGLAEEVVVSDSAVGGDSRGSAMVTTLTAEEIETLPDDPEDLQTFIEELAGPGGATFFLNGFRGGQLPSRDEIRAIRIRSNSFSADSRESGGRTGVEIFTRPSTGSYGGGVSFNYQGDALNARNAQSTVQTPEGTKQVQFQFRGPIVRNKTSFSLNLRNNDQYRSNAIIAVDQFGNRLGTQVRMPSESRSVDFSVEHALTSTSTMRLSYQGNQNEGRNQGLGNFDLPERASERNSSGHMYRGQLQGVVRGTMLNEFRVQFNRRTNESLSVTEAPTVIVQDAFNAGGAGVNSRSQDSTFEIADNFDFNLGTRHQMRAGLLVEGGRYSNFDQTNALGRTTYASLEDFAAGRPLQYTQRVGLLDTSFSQYQLGFYVQDDFRVSNRLSVGFGVRNEMQSHIGDKLNLMPRVGFALSPFGETTSIRGGYGIYYDWYGANLHDTTLRLNGLAQRDILINYIYDEQGNLLNSVSPESRPSNRTVAAPDLEMPYVHQASVGLQQQLPGDVQFQATYQRILGRNQLRGRDINYGVLTTDEFGRPVRVRPDPQWNIVTQIESTGESERDSLTFQVRKQFRTEERQWGFMNLSYQLGEGRSNFGGATSLPSDSLNLDLDWGPDGQDVRHQFQAQGVAMLPYELRLQTRIQLRSAPAYNMTTGRDDNFDGVINDRPDGVTRNSLRGDATWHLTNLSIQKTIGFGGPRADGGGGGAQRGGGPRGGGGFPGGGRGGNFGGNSRYNVQLSLDVSNPLNRVIRQGYTGNMLSPFFGTATGVAQARRVEFNTSFRF
jgi:hypothetical protein